MFHMLTCFNLDAGTDIADFRDALETFTAHMKSAGLVESCGSIGQRQSDTRLDTDAERDHQYFVVMSFRDREQSDRALTELYKHEGRSERLHHAVYSRAKDPIFICWQDL